ncbi:NUDIX domain-containing protein [Georgenia sp. MJ206]|uniref:NUDIX domain-containing protein n=1 Tax=Georgenia wangjunii TaxID=3117730 RepID=UPI002F26B724
MSGTPGAAAGERTGPAGAAHAPGDPADLPAAQADPVAPGDHHGRFQVVPAAYVVLTRAGADGPEVLLQLRRGTGYMDGYWACGAAGHVEAGESVHAAAAREAREELGVRIAAADLLPLTAMHRTAGNGRAIDERVDFFFSCRHWEGEPRAAEDAKTADLRWIALDRLDELGAPVVPHERVVLDGLLRGDLPPVVTVGFDPVGSDPAG